MKHRVGLKAEHKPYSRWEISVATEKDDLLFSVFSMSDFTFLQHPFPHRFDWLSQIVLWCFFPLVLERLKIFTYTENICGPLQRLKGGGADRISTERVTNHSALEERNMEEKRWQQQWNTRPLMKYSRLWLKKDQRTNVSLFLLSLSSCSHRTSPFYSPILGFFYAFVRSKSTKQKSVRLYDM